VDSILSVLLFIGFLYLMMRYGCGAHIHGGGCGHMSHHDHKADERNETEKRRTA
jgi:hypothetical protein